MRRRTRSRSRRNRVAARPRRSGCGRWVASSVAMPALHSSAPHAGVGTMTSGARRRNGRRRLLDARAVIVILKVMAAVAPLVFVGVGERQLPAWTRARRVRLLGWIAAVGLIVYGGVLTFIGLLVEGGVVHAAETPTSEPLLGTRSSGTPGSHYGGLHSPWPSGTAARARPIRPRNGRTMLRPRSLGPVRRSRGLGTSWSQSPGGVSRRPSGPGAASDLRIDQVQQTGSLVLYAVGQPCRQDGQAPPFDLSLVDRAEASVCA